MSTSCRSKGYFRSLSASLIGVALVCPVYGQERPTRGKVVYEGTYTGKQTEGFILFNQGPQLVGAITLTVEFDGKAIRATYKTTGKLAGGSANGVVEGDVCKLFGSGNLTIEADCTADSFNGKLFQQPRPELRREVAFELSRRSDSAKSGSPSPVQGETPRQVITPPESQSLATAPVTEGEPPPKIASVVYQGTYSGVKTSSSRAGTNPTEMSGAFTVTFQFDGPSVIADFNTTGTISSFKMTGSRDGTLCKVFSSRGTSLAGTCNTASLDAVLRSVSDAREQLNVRFKATTTKLTDIEKQRETTAADRAKREAEQATAAEVRKRDEDAERARLEKLLQSLPPAKR